MTDDELVERLTQAHSGHLVHPFDDYDDECDWNATLLQAAVESGELIPKSWLKESGRQCGNCGFWGTFIKRPDCPNCEANLVILTPVYIIDKGDS